MVRFQAGVLLDKTELFYGISIIENIKINNISIKIGKKEVILLLGNAIEGVKLMDFYIIIKYFFSLTRQIESIFGLTVSPGMCFVRRKLKNDIYCDISIENLLSLLEGSDTSVYYSKKGNESIEQVLGIEIRFKEDIDVDPDKTVISLIRKLGDLEKERRFYGNERK